MNHSNDIKGSDTGLRNLKTLFLILLFFTSASSQAQFRHKLRSSNLILEGRVYYGFTMAHHIELEPFQKHYPALEISVFKATYGNTRWEYMYNYPNIGISYWYSGLGNFKSLGRAHAVFPYISFPLAGTDNFTFFFRLGIGLGYLTENYNRINNYKNLSIGSHLNGCANLLFEAKLRAGPKMILSGGISLTHFSNGSIKTPNYGLNMPAVSVAAAYRLSRENPHLRKKLLPELIPFEFDGKKRVYADIAYAMGVKDLQSTLGVGNLYLVYTLAANALLPLGYKSKAGIGLDASFDASEITLLDLRGVPVEHKVNVVKTGITGAYELMFSKMSMMFNIGAILTGMEQSKGVIYEKLGIRYYFNRKLFANMTLKAHYARADYLTFGVGYNFGFIYY